MDQVVAYEAFSRRLFEDEPSPQVSKPSGLYRSCSQRAACPGRHRCRRREPGLRLCGGGQKHTEDSRRLLSGVGAELRGGRSPREKARRGGVGFAAEVDLLKSENARLQAENVGLVAKAGPQLRGGLGGCRGQRNRGMPGLGLARAGLEVTESQGRPAGAVRCAVRCAPGPRRCSRSRGVRCPGGPAPRRSGCRHRP